MHIKFFSFLLFCFIILNNAAAQNNSDNQPSKSTDLTKEKPTPTKLTLGFHIGLNVTNLVVKSQDTILNENQFPKPGIAFGPILYFKVHRLIDVKTGINFSVYGFSENVNLRYSSSAISNSNQLVIRTNTNFYYFQLPLVIKGTFSEKNDATFYYEAGGYFGYMIQGFTKSKIKNRDDNIPPINIQNYTYKIGNDSDDDITPFDAGLRFGIGLNFNTFDLGAAYSLGVKNLAPSSQSELSAYNHNFQFSFIYKIPYLKS